MSLSGKLLRGLGWHNYRNLDGVYNDDILEDPHKMEELTFYLEFMKGKDKNKVHKILHRIRVCDLQNKEPMRAHIAKELEDEKKMLPDKKKDNSEKKPEVK